jgi:hypothetical protein
VSRPDPAAKAFMSAAVRNPATAQALHAFFAGRYEQAVIVGRAIERRELPVGTDAAEVIRFAVAPIYYRLFITGEQIDQTVADRAAAAALVAARAGVFQG